MAGFASAQSSSVPQERSEIVALWDELKANWLAALENAPAFQVSFQTTTQSARRPQIVRAGTLARNQEQDEIVSALSLTLPVTLSRSLEQMATRTELRWRIVF